MAGWQHAGGLQPAWKSSTSDHTENTKEELSTESHLEGKMFLFSRGADVALAECAHRASLSITGGVGSLLDRAESQEPDRALVRKKGLVIG